MFLRKGRKQTADHNHPFLTLKKKKVCVAYFVENRNDDQRKERKRENGIMF
jgi:hypothetical protein